ncbi:MAG: FHA domain-containing protein [Kofleriaceae bacterium]
MIVCNRCGKENQDHYKFCLGCGAELTAPPKQGDVAMMKTMMSDPGVGPSVPRVGTPVGAPPLGSPPKSVPRPPGGMAGMPPAGPLSPGAPMGPPPGVPGFSPGFAPPPPQQPPLPQASASLRRCPSCGSDVAPSFRFCGTCGFRMDEPSGPVQMPPPSAAPQAGHGRLSMTLIRPDGQEGGVHELVHGVNRIGRNFGSLFENDGYLSPVHAELTLQPNGSGRVRDLDSLNGVFVKMTQEEELVSGQIVRIGQELLRFEFIGTPEPSPDGTELMGSPNPGYWGKLIVIIGRDVTGAVFPLLGESVSLGRERGEINFPDDGYVSGLHARVVLRDGRAFLSDLGSSNGTFIKVNGERAIGHESFILLGQQLFRIASM